MQRTTSSNFTVACVQLNAQDDMSENLNAIADWVAAAVAQGAQLVCLPENATVMTFGRTNLWDKAYPEAQHPAIAAFRSLAQQHGIYLHGGTLHVRLDHGKLANRTYVFAPDGQIIATYDKIHMFDVDLGDGERYQESAFFEPGAQAVIATLADEASDFGALGLSVCYDLRFPHLFRTLAKYGARILVVPAAFTHVTGCAHWHVLLRARAIETGCFVVAPAQTGWHCDKRRTYGHSLIISPWGEVLADAGDAPGIVVASLPAADIFAARSKVPSLYHDRGFAPPHASAPTFAETNV
jgi:predicted amidohydrolase